MKVDSHIIQAIDKVIAEKGICYEEFARQLGVSNAAITKWRKVGNGITSMRWKTLFPLLKKYLPQDRIYIDDAQQEQYSSAASKTSAYFFEPKYIPLMVPVFTAEQLSSYDDTLESVTQLGARLKATMTEYHPKHKEKSSIFALRLGNNKLAPIFPEHSTLFVCAGERPADTGLVVVLPIGGSTTIGYYKKDGDTFSVTPVGERSPSISGKISDAKKLVTWIFPVLYYEVVTF